MSSARLAFGTASEQRMIYGTAWKKERTLPLVLQALEAGFRRIDTAAQLKHYEEPLVRCAAFKLVVRSMCCVCMCMRAW